MLVSIFICLFQLFKETRPMKPRVIKHRQIVVFGHTDNACNIHSHTDTVFDFMYFLVPRNVIFDHSKLQVCKKIHIFNTSINYVTTNVIHHIKLTWCLVCIPCNKCSDSWCFSKLCLNLNHIIWLCMWCSTYNCLIWLQPNSLGLQSCCLYNWPCSCWVSTLNVRIELQLHLSLTWPTVSGTVCGVWELENLGHIQDILRHQILSPLQIWMGKLELKMTSSEYIKIILIRNNFSTTLSAEDEVLCYVLDPLVK